MSSFFTPITFTKIPGNNTNDSKSLNKSMVSRRYLLSNKILKLKRIKWIEKRIASLKTKRSLMQKLLAKCVLQLDQLESSEIRYFVNDPESDSLDTENTAEVIQTDVDKMNESVQA